MKMTCEKVKSLLSAYLDRELDSYELRQIELHLLDCKSCKEECQTLRKTKNLLGILDSPKLPEEFWPELKDQINSPYPKPKTYSRLFLKIIIPAAALLILAILPLTLIIQTKTSKGIAKMQIDPVNAYIREYAISGLDRPFSDKTSLKFVATGQAVSMYSSDLLSPYGSPSIPDNSKTVMTPNQIGRKTEKEPFQSVMFLSPK